MKAKSMKLRMLVTLHALWKHSDAKHRMNTVKLNKYLEPFGLNCTSRVLGDTVRILKEYGVDVRYKGEWDSQGVWIEDRPLSSSALESLIFAVSTNPHLTKEQATEILSQLKPLVTEYQEPYLKGTVETKPTIHSNDKLYHTYSIICKAIELDRRLTYTIDYIKCNKERQSVEVVQEWKTLFTPKCVYQTDNTLYMVGYNNTDRRLDAIDLRDITDIDFAFKHNAPNKEKVREMLDAMDPAQYIPGEAGKIIYTGPVTFRCRGQYVGELYKRFGPPEGPVKKDARGRTTYSVKEARISSETLFWLSQVNNYGIRIEGPGELTKAIKGYHAEVANTLTDRRLPKNNE